MAHMSLKIGNLANATGVNTQTIRFYERESLLPIPKRSPAGYRLYESIDIDRILFIKQAQRLGFSLSEIRELLNLRVDANRDCTPVRIHTEIKIEQMKKKINELTCMVQTLESLVEDCHAKRTISTCLILQSLEAKKE